MPNSPTSSKLSAPDKDTPWTLGYDRRALEKLHNLPEKIRRQIQRRIDALVINPHPVGSKKLYNIRDTGDPVHSEESGGYRILYVLRKAQRRIDILDAGDRKDIYRNR